MTTSLETLDAAIQIAAVNGQSRVKVGNQEVEMRSLSELLEWRKQLIAEQAATRSGMGLRLQQITPVYR